MRTTEEEPGKLMALSKPTNFRSTARNHNSVTLEWDSARGARPYEGEQQKLGGS